MAWPYIVALVVLAFATGNWFGYWQGRYVSTQEHIAYLKKKIEELRS